ncbi:hypothetical protein NQ317_016500 [Molorchus minor]|uniref:ribonuclease H n=1 Tax=Molorchus minor TaxID=1323400 RepID=A0ABQ9JVY0_9CUCU|nr:hypothetical protein NQ317_016500 [Molorchus minor]
MDLKQTVEQALESMVKDPEVHAIELCLRENIERGYKVKTILIYCDSQAALQALACKNIKSKLIWNCLETLQALGNQNKVTLKWVPGHKGVEGNEEADTLARKGSDTALIGPEPMCGIPKSSVRLWLTPWKNKKHQSYWDHIPGQTNSKWMVKAPTQSLTNDILRLSRNQIRLVTGTHHMGTVT